MCEQSFSPSGRIVNRMERIDEDDRRLLREIQNSALISAAALAKKLGLSEPVVRRKRRRLERVGIISGYHTELDPKKLGFLVSAILKVLLNGEDLSRMRRVIKASPEILECDRTIGNEAYIMKVLVRSTEELEAVIDRLIPFGHVSSTLVTSSPVKKRQPPIAFATEKPEGSLSE
jgi:Lrp/AsnC family leucine-responsive transcriptional regulator